MKSVKQMLLKGYKRILQTGLVALVLLTFSFGLSAAGWNYSPEQPTLISILAQGDAVTDPQAILRNALPIDNPTIRQIQANLEGFSKDLRGKRWAPVKKNVRDAAFLLNSRRAQILASVPESRQPQAETLIEQIKAGVEELQEIVDAQDKPAVYKKRAELLAQITDLEELMLQEFPFQVPAEYANLPQLKGRATVDIETTQGTLKIVVDGYSAPVNAGNFVDLVNRGFYDGLPFIDTEDNFAIQSGDPPGSEAGFIDPKTGEYRAIPMEVLVKGEPEPIYGMTLEEAGIYLPDLALPFSAYGTVALARPSLDPNGGSSQFFLFKFDNELTPPGFNLMDGRYSVFGYLVEGNEVLEKLTDKDKIISAKVVDGLDNLVPPQT